MEKCSGPFETIRVSTSFGQDTWAFVFLLFKISPSAFNDYSSPWLKNIIIVQHILLLKVIHIPYVFRASQQAREEVGQVSTCVHAEEVSSRKREHCGSPGCGKERMTGSYLPSQHFLPFQSLLNLRHCAGT